MVSKLSVPLVWTKIQSWVSLSLLKGRRLSHVPREAGPEMGPRSLTGPFHNWMGSGLPKLQMERQGNQGTKGEGTQIYVDMSLEALLQALAWVWLL